ncbi:hypothetical protein PAECIP111893_00529 [Paenibacillus plantiphilus]|uniref:Uncharacterized protein n=1 Tax=Paenibacillus plantiphilus TaxID=2905650 RepID=A0ABM9BTS4_9BACL|nr:hypothetical protein [Paenibacillus plantiphilus]CAH1193690.1 hypothetical protein PAECIP111893_00529 [Paenibacillus plantiphilus]
MRKWLLACSVLTLLLTGFHEAVAASPTRTITNIAQWQHPTKEIFTAYDVELLKVVIKNGNYPVFSIKLPQPSGLQAENLFNKFIKDIAKANGYWPFKIVQGEFAATVGTIQQSKLVTSISYAQKYTYITSASAAIPTNLAKAGLHPVPIAATFKHAIDKRIAALLSQPSSYTDSDWSSGLIQTDSNNMIINDRFKAAIVGTVRIGDTIKDIRTKLGTPGFSEGDMIFYRTSNYYIGFKGKNRLEQAIIGRSPALGATDKDILKKLLVTMNGSPKVPDVLSAVTADPSLDAFFDQLYHLHGIGGYHASSKHGIEMSDGEEQHIGIYNNFTGNLYANASGGSYKISYIDKDLTIERLTSDNSVFDYSNEQFRSAGTLSPSGNYTMYYEWVYSMLQYFHIRTVDNSKPDFKIHIASLDSRWITDQYLLTIDFYSSKPELIPVLPDGDGNSAKRIDVFKAVGIPFDEDAYSAVEIVKATDSSFTLKVDETSFTIAYRLYKNGDIKLQRI